MLTFITTVRYWALLKFEFLDYQVPVYILIITGLFFLILVLPKRTFSSWRVKASKKWLKSFRANKRQFNSSQRFNYIRKVDHYLFEDILMTCFEERGYKVIRTKLSWDEGSDGYVTINKHYMAIQAKRYTGRISKQHVEALNTLVERKPKLKKGIFIHSGKSSAPILEYIQSNPNLDMISGVDKLIRFLDGGQIKVFGMALNELQS
jgi:hypothetical protein